MYDIKNLEKQWKLYSRKKLLRLSVLALLLLISVSLFVFFGANRQDKRKQTANSFDTNLSISSYKHPQKQEEASAKNLSTEVSSGSKSNSTKKGWHITFEDTNNAQKQPPLGSATKHIDIKVSDKKSQNNVKDMENSFSTSDNKDDALFLSKYYYDKKQYKKSLKWALEANKLDSNIEESWLIFCKSKAKLGFRAEAIRVLQTYYDRYGSKKQKIFWTKSEGINHFSMKRIRIQSL